MVNADGEPESTGSPSNLSNSARIVIQIYSIITQINLSAQTIRNYAGSNVLLRINLCCLREVSVPPRRLFSRVRTFTPRSVNFLVCQVHNADSIGQVTARLHRRSKASLKFWWPTGERFCPNSCSCQRLLLKRHGTGNERLAIAGYQRTSRTHSLAATCLKRERTMYCYPIKLLRNRLISTPDHIRFVPIVGGEIASIKG